MMLLPRLIPVLFFAALSSSFGQLNKTNDVFDAIIWKAFMNRAPGYLILNQEIAPIRTEVELACEISDFAKQGDKVYEYRFIASGESLRGVIYLNPENQRILYGIGDWQKEAK